ncbi:peptidoglycan-binding protein LysM [Actimicrobium antarcticum]|uniref:Peptidoglycan-binding protein LysM n=1 Tax=Actimicrobium antarcticum TaxID=1051899 RepID=A0ABP7T206_9BURK
MSLISFIKDAGEKLLNAASVKQDDADAPLDAPVDTSSEELHGKERVLEQAILDYMKVQNLPTDQLTVTYDASSTTVTVSGSVPDQATREKVLLCCGNVQGVAHVTDLLVVPAGTESESRMYTVKSGDTLSKIAASFYGDAGKYQRIFDANQPMLSDPDKIYPGQTLRIPT